MIIIWEAVDLLFAYHLISSLSRRINWYIEILFHCFFLQYFFYREHHDGIIYGGTDARVCCVLLNIQPDLTGTFYAHTETQQHTHIAQVYAWPLSVFLTCTLFCIIVNVRIKNISRDYPCWKYQLRPEFACWSSLVYARKVCWLSKLRIPVWDTSILEFHCTDQHPKLNICWWAATYADLFIRDVGLYKMCWYIH